MDDLQDLMKRCLENGLNIYQLKAKFKKHSKLRVELPNEVVRNVCKSYLLRMGSINNTWAWGWRVTVEETRRYFAKKNQKK